MPRVRRGGWGWIGLAVYVAAVDVWLIRARRPTLSQVFGDALKHPARRWPVVVAWVAITLHLFGELIPPRLRSALSPIDPIGALARAIEPRV